MPKLKKAPVTPTPQAPAKRPFVPGDARCLVCGCTDSFACMTGCYWVKIDRRKNTGICSVCYFKRAPKQAKTRPAKRRKKSSR